MSQQRVETGPATFGQFIGGTWRAAESGRVFDDLDPWSGDVVAQFAAGSGADDARRMRRAPTRPSAPGRTRSPGLRQDIFLKAADDPGSAPGTRSCTGSLCETGCGKDFGAHPARLRTVPAPAGRRGCRTPPSAR